MGFTAGCEEVSTGSGLASDAEIAPVVRFVLLSLTQNWKGVMTKK